MPTIYSKVKKVLDGTLDASKLFIEDLSNFLINELLYAQSIRCMHNQQYNQRQATIMWYVDDLKILHTDEKIVTYIIYSLRTRCGETMPPRISCGKIHEYFGMIFDY